VCVCVCVNCEYLKAKIVFVLLQNGERMCFLLALDYYLVDIAIAVIAQTVNLLVTRGRTFYWWSRSGLWVDHCISGAV